MKRRSRRLLRGLATALVGVAAIAMVKSNAVMAATSRYSLSELNQGAAKVLDSLDRGADIESSEEGSDDSADPDSDDPDSHMSDLVMANVRQSLNVREEPNEESSKVGLLYADCGGTILDTDGDWTKIQSGKLIGWCSNEYLLFDEEAEELAQSVGITLASVNADALRVRKEASEDAGVWGLVKRGDQIEVITEHSTDDWVAIEFEGEEGFLSSEYLDIKFSVDAGETYEDIKERERREKEEKAKLKKNLGAVAVDAPDETLLGALVYCEAGNQPYEGQLAVAAVVMNRVRSAAYPNTVSGVIYASGQFTPALNGKVAARVQAGVPATALQAASEAIAGNTNVGTATHFRRWTGQEGIVIGAHVFY
ncbi:MAG: cell wall hydrolase [Lachnospiraceae bacterium]|nr:cell wall hydrolase [Lachnospiraceae bacterium]